MASSKAGYVRCIGAKCGCRKANYGLGCYHRKLHKYNNNCLVGHALDTGLGWCSFLGVYCKCETPTTKRP